MIESAAFQRVYVRRCSIASRTLFYQWKSHHRSISPFLRYILTRVVDEINRSMNVQVEDGKLKKNIKPLRSEVKWKVKLYFHVTKKIYYFYPYLYSSPLLWRNIQKPAVNVTSFGFLRLLRSSLLMISDLKKAKLGAIQHFLILFKCFVRNEFSAISQWMKNKVMGGTKHFTNIYSSSILIFLHHKSI